MSKAAEEGDEPRIDDEPYPQGEWSDDAPEELSISPPPDFRSGRRQETTSQPQWGDGSPDGHQ